MKIEYTDVICGSSFMDPNTWFIFRPNGVEIKVVLNETKIASNKELTTLELDFIKHNIL